MYQKYQRSELFSAVNLTPLPRVWKGKLTGRTQRTLLQLFSPYL